jgi:outer membrane protein OmpA-like peptidoglycan-associated protein
MALTANAFAQGAKLKKADKLFDLYAYAEAIELYYEVLETHPDNAHATIRLAECYRKVNEPIHSEMWFAKVVALPERQPIHVLYYAQALMMNEKYDEAKVQFQKYSELNPSDSRGPNGVRAVNSMAALKASQKDFAVINQEFNTSAAEFGPAYYNSGLVFSSDRPGAGEGDATFKWTGRPFLNMWYATTTGNNAWSEPEPLTGIIQTKYHDGPATFYPGGTEMLFTRNYIVGKGKVQKSSDDVVGLKVMKASKGEGDQWKEASDIGLNSLEFSTGHPALSSDGRTLFFTSDRPGTRGGSDIWMSTLNGTEWAEPINLGASINTEGTEGFPFFSEDSVLYFASDGHSGLGGLDIFYSKMKSNGNFGPPINAGAPLNTSADDFALITKRGFSEGYLSSNRRGGVGEDDIYAFVSMKATVEIYVYDCDTKVPIYQSSVVVKVPDGEPLTGLTDREGILYKTVLRNMDYECVASKAGYPSDSTEFNTRYTMAGDTIRVEICLSRGCVVKGIVKDRQTGELISGATVEILNRVDNTRQTVMTGADGRYQFDVAEGTYVLTAKKEGYVYDERQVTATQMSGPCIVDQDLELEKFGAIVLEHVYYDFDKWNIRVDASTDLHKLLRILQDNPMARVELGSHTDSRGTDEYNRALSERRAKAAVDWLVSQGISRDRLVAKGYGETQLRNDCGNGVPCTEYEHQRNRRTEVTVIKPNGEKIVGREHFNDPSKRFEHVPGGWYRNDPRVNGTLLPGGVVPPGVVPDPPPPQPPAPAPQPIP